ncbi:unnamed protein product [Euphydryas editha]|uniref:Reverse transcriptase domain-containing protein n=1 Tax=Euphydryas editha TaxID=104508 RepID=A0AAU9UCW1_EUPED|nr:unnamed protein product [Euphydryas editha]
MKNELSALNKLVGKYLRRDYRDHRRYIIEKHLGSSGSLKRANNELRLYKTWIEGLRMSDEEAPQCLLEEDLNVAEIQPIQETEIIREIKRLKPNKSPGPDGIANEALKIACTILTTPLTILFNKILDTSITPKEWSESNIILLYKKGDPKDVSNYRPISLLPTLYKLFSSIIEKRISPTLDSFQPIEQAGFRRGYSTVDHIHTVELLMEKYQEHQSVH